MANLKLLLRIATGLALLAYLFFEHDVRLGNVLDNVLGMPVLIVLGAFAIDLAGQSLSAFRWSRIARLAGHPVTFLQAWPVYFSGMFFNTCLPTSVGGDVIRTVGLGRQIKSKTAAFSTVFMDRNVGMAALLTLGLISSLIWRDTTIEATFYGTRLLLPLWPLFMLLILGYVLVNVALFNALLFKTVDAWILGKSPEALRAKVSNLHGTLQGYRRPLKDYALVYGVSLLYQASEVTAVWLLARGLGFELPIWVFGALVTFQAVAGLLPITINNIGVREGLFCAVLIGQASLLGWETELIKEKALALALLYFGLIVASGVVGGLVYLVHGIQPADDTRPVPVEAVDHAKPGIVS